MYETKLLYNELVQLEKNNNTGKVDHIQGFSKDQADAIAGATYTASKYAEEFAYDYGEDINLVGQINNNTDFYTQQLTVNFEDELKKTFQTFHNSMPQQKEPDYGMGKATTNYTIPLLHDGICLW